MNCHSCHHRASCRFDAFGRQCYCQCHDVADQVFYLIGMLLLAEEGAKLELPAAYRELLERTGLPAKERTT